MLANELVDELNDTFTNLFVSARKVFARRGNVIPLDQRPWRLGQVLQLATNRDDDVGPENVFVRRGFVIGIS